MGIQTLRTSKKARLWIIGILIVLAVAALFLVKKAWAKAVIGVVIALLVGAFGMEVANTDYNLGTVAKTGSFTKAKIERDPKTGNLVNIDKFCSSPDIDYNCDDFKTQAEAMDVYDRCSAAGKDMDTFRLDGDKDGKVCEALPTGTN